jgi:ribosome assembly protein YihI (activator of Der GTPase)
MGRRGLHLPRRRRRSVRPRKDQPPKAQGRVQQKVSEMNEDELIQAIIDRFSPDELCEILDISTIDFVDKFYDEVLESETLRVELGIDDDDEAR